MSRPHHASLQIAFVILTLAFVQLLTRIVPCGSQLWAIQYTWSTGTAAVATRTVKFAKASDKCYTQQKGHSLVTDKYECTAVHMHDNDLWEGEWLPWLQIN